MKSRRMERLQRRAHDYDEKRRRFLDRLAGLAPTKIADKPSPDRWSLLQVAEHLMLGDREILHSRHAGGADRSLRNRLLFALVLMILRLGIRVDVPSAAMRPGGETSLEELREQWDQLHVRFRDYISSMDDNSLELTVCSHPVVGPMTISQTLTLAHVHFDSHMRKVRARLRDAGDVR